MMLAVAGLWFTVNSGAGKARFDQEAEAALKSLYGYPVRADLGRTHLSFDSAQLVGLKVENVQLARADNGAAVTSARSIEFGIRLASLLTGELRIGSVRVAGAEVMAGAIEGSDSDPLAPIRDAQGRLDPDRAAAGVFALVSDAFEKLAASGTRRIDLAGSRIALGASVLDVEFLSLKRTSDRDMSVTGKLTIDAVPVSLQARATRDGAGGIQNLQARLDMTGLSFGTEAPALSAQSASLTLSGSETAAPARLQAGLNVRDARIDLGSDGVLNGQLRVSANFGEGAGKVEFSNGILEINRSRIPFDGAAGPTPAGDPGAASAYRYEFVSNDALLAASDVNDAGIKAGARIGGIWDPASGQLDASEFGIRTDGGEVVGTASLVFGESSPAFFLAIRSPRMPVAHVKHIWPWVSAPGARDWVVNHLFDGTVTNSQLELSASAGRLTDGIPFSRDEIHGHFEVDGTRFDIAGNLPPVRDAAGVIDFAGNDVTIGLSRGVAFMNGGRTVTGSNGTLTIKNAHVDPVIGKLEIDISGDAASIIDMASRKPIDAGERLQMQPEQFEGSARGRVVADIPLDSSVSVSTLDWSVALDFAGLAIDKEFDGQKLTEAKGRITINPRQAELDAEGKLNGIPATVSLLEPLGKGAKAARRDVTLSLNDKQRNAMAPGLAELLSGPVDVRISSAGDTQKVEADLSKAEFRVPWLGWTKGKGIAGKATFDIATSGRTTRVSNLSVGGKSFAIKGDIRLENGDMREVRLSKVQLNRDDDYALSMKSDGGKSVAIAISGNAIDARPLIQRFNSDSDKALQDVSGLSLAVTASVDRMTGFDNETLRNVRLGLKGSGSNVGSVDMTAVAAKGAAVEMSYNGGADRKLEIRTADAGAILRFLDIYGRMEGGQLNVQLAGAKGGPLKGKIGVRDFWLVDEPRLRSMVSKPAPQSDGRSLSDAIKKDIDVSRVKFDRGFVEISKGEKNLEMSNGVLRGPLIGTTFQGTLYDAKGNMAVTGTFMPAYGLNRIFGEIPLLGQILGNGRDRGLIGITYKLKGKAKSPDLLVNPISVIAPGVFRTIFEFK